MTTDPGRKERADDGPLLDRNPRLAVIIFIVVALAAAALYLWFGREHWFYLDEWDFLAGRSLTSVDDLLRPHNEHWSTVPIVIWRVLWNVFGIRTYRPYQLLSIANWLGIAALARVVMRRAGVGPWIATGAAVTLVLFGSGNQDAIWAFQIQFAGPLLFGLAHLLLADHKGPLDRRDWLGLLAGLAAIMSSGLGVTMVFVVGLSTLLKRGWRLALFHTLPLVLIYAAWWMSYGRDSLQSTNSGFALTRRFVAEGYRRTFNAMGMVPRVGVVLGAVLVVGLVLGWHRINRPEVRRLAAAPLALLLGGVVFFATAGWGRAWVYGPAFAGTSRYLHVAAVLTMPALAVAIDAIYRRWHILGMAAGALLLVGIPGNVRRTVDYAELNALALGQPGLFLAVANAPEAREVSRALHPFPDSAEEVTVGWLLDGVESGKIPKSTVPLDARSRAIIGFRLGLQQVNAPEGALTNCVPLGGATELELQPGEFVDFSGGGLQVVTRDPGAPPNYFVTFYPQVGDRLVVVGEAQSLRLTSANVFTPASLCQ